MRPRSTGCFACVSRKVKCDEGKPWCDRCLKRNQPCPGYRDRDELLFRHSQAVQAQQATPQLAALHDLNSPTSTILDLKPDWAQAAVSYFLSNFVVRGRGGRLGYFEFLPDLLHNTSSSCLRYSVLAISAGSLATTRGFVAIGGESRKLYLKALTALRAELDGKDQRGNDNVLATVMLLSRYEIIMGEKSAAQNPHGDAELALSGLGPASTPTANERQGMALIISREHALAALCDFRALAPEAAPPAMEELPAVSQADFPGHLLQAHRVCSLLRRVKARAQIQDLETAVHYLHAGIALERGAREWATELDAQWQYSTMRFGGGGEEEQVSGPWSTAEYGGDAAHVFVDVQLAGCWTSFWCSRLVLLKTLMAVHAAEPFCHLLAPEMLDSERYEREVGEIAENVCACAPYLLGELDEDAYVSPPGKKPGLIGPQMLTLSLYAVGCLAVLPQVQYNWVVRKLGDIGNKWGIRQALVFQERLLPKVV